MKTDSMLGTIISSYPIDINNSFIYCVQMQDGNYTIAYNIMERINIELKVQPIPNNAVVELYEENSCGTLIFTFSASNSVNHYAPCSVYNPSGTASGYSSSSGSGSGSETSSCSCSSDPKWTYSYETCSGIDCNSTTCPDCKGTGKYIGFTKTEPCSKCNGMGKL